MDLRIDDRPLAWARLRLLASRSLGRERKARTDGAVDEVASRQHTVPFRSATPGHVGCGRDASLAEDFESRARNEGPPPPDSTTGARARMGLCRPSASPQTCPGTAGRSPRP